MRWVVVGCGNVGFETVRGLVRDEPEDEVLVVDVLLPAHLERFLAGDGRDPARLRFERADASDPADLARALDAWGGEIDVLVSTVGSFAADSGADPERFRADFERNVFGNLVPMLEAAERMVARGRGRIIVLSSTSGVHAPADLRAYAPSKWALENLCGALRSELAPHGVRVDWLVPATLRNRYSRDFVFERGMEPARVAQAILRIARRGGAGGRHFVPRRFGLLRAVERLLPAVLDRHAGLGSARRRRRANRGRRPRSALVTGASSGLGRELARLYAPTLAELHVVARDEAALQALRREIGSVSRCAVTVHRADLADWGQVLSLARSLPPVDLVVLNAGLHVRGPLRDTPFDLLRRCFTVNLLAPVALVRLQLERGPPAKLACVLSTTAIAGRAQLGAYSASKGALWSFTRSLRRVWGDRVQVLEVLAATFSSRLFEKGVRVGPEPRRSAPSARVLTAARVAGLVRAAERAGRESVTIPREAKLFLLLEVLCPPLFRRLFP